MTDLSEATTSDLFERIAQLEEDLLALRERAERVQEGEDWDLAEFIIRKTSALKESDDDQNISG